MRLNVQSLSVLKGGRATAALLSAKENQKTELYLEEVRSETGDGVARRPRPGHSSPVGSAKPKIGS